jgi:hypothetical protein
MKLYIDNLMQLKEAFGENLNIQKLKEIGIGNGGIHATLKEYCYSYLTPSGVITNEEIETPNDGKASIYQLSDKIYWCICDTETNDEEAFFEYIDEAQKWVTETLYLLTQADEVA